MFACPVHDDTKLLPGIVDCHSLVKNVYNRPFPPTFAICRNCQKLRYWVGFVGVLSVNAGERRSPSERSNPAFRVCIN